MVTSQEQNYQLGYNLSEDVQLEVWWGIRKGKERGEGGLTNKAVFVRSMESQNLSIQEVKTLWQKLIGSILLK